jgi:starch synthase
LEKQVKELAEQDSNIVAICKFDEIMAHKIYAGSDVMLIPSKYEPCGLVQMIAMRYGSVPIVRETGGLKDTVTENETGFLFKNYSHEELIDKINMVSEKFENRELLRQFQIKDMEQDFSWNRSALIYLKTYQQIIWDNL